MTPDHDAADTDGTGSARLDRRNLLKLAGGSAIGVAAVGQATAGGDQSQPEHPHQFVFFECEEVCTDAGGNHVVVHRDGKYTCERIAERRERENVTWTHDNTYCYSTDDNDEKPPGQIVGAIEENEYRGNEHVGEGCRLCLNPNECAEQFLPDDPCDVLDALDECGPCLDGDGKDMIFCGDCESATGISANGGNGNGNMDGKGDVNGNGDGNGKGNGKGKKKSKGKKKGKGKKKSKGKGKGN